jgi:hypothetical protein
LVNATPAPAIASVLRKSRLFIAVVLIGLTF